MSIKEARDKNAEKETDSLNSFGKSPRVLPRYELSRVLFNGLPEATRENVLCNKAISSVATTETGVTVDCADGTTYTGDMIIGTDGVHSTVRAQMNKLAREELGESINSDTLFPTTYRCVWMRFPVDGLAVAPGGDMAPGATCESHGYDAATQMFAADDHAAAGIYQKLEKPTTERLRFTKEDEEAVVAELGHLPLSRDGTVTVSSAYAMSTGSGIVALEEGVLDCWNWGGRIVLAGDSAHKFSPITGAGCNNGIIDVVVLVNELRALMQNDEKGSAPTAKDLRKVFESYEESRKPAVQEQCMRASQVTATATWATLVGRVMDLYVLPWAFVQKLFISLVASKVAETPCFDFLPADKHIVGTVAWKTPARVVV